MTIDPRYYQQLNIPSQPIKFFIDFIYQFLIYIKIYQQFC